MVQPLALGRRSPKNAPALLFASFWTGILPDPPAQEDYLKVFPSWEILGNDVHGDCVAVGSANLTRVTTKYLSQEVYPSLDEVIAFYKTQNPDYPAQDDGMEMQTALGYWLHNGFAGRNLVAYAKLDPHNLDAIKAAIAIFGCVLFGVKVQDVNLTQFRNGQAWDYVEGANDEGGHCVAVGGYLSDTTHEIEFVTWGQVTTLTDNFLKHQLGEVWLPILPEHLGTKEFEQGIDLAALASAYQTLTGRVLPLPTPSPIPVPTPTPTPPSSTWTVTTPDGVAHYLREV